MRDCAPNDKNLVQDSNEFLLENDIPIEINENDSKNSQITELSKTGYFLLKNQKKLLRKFFPLKKTIIMLW